MEFWAFPKQQPGTIRIAVGQAHGPHRCMMNHDSYTQQQWNSGQSMSVQGWQHYFEFWAFPSKPEAEVERVECLLAPLLLLHGGSDAKYTEEVSYEVGYETTNHSQETVATVAASTSWKIGLQGSANMDAQYKSTFQEATSHTSTKSKATKKWEINLASKGFFLYQGVVRLIMKDGSVVTMKGSSMVQSAKPLVETSWKIQ